LPSTISIHLARTRSEFEAAHLLLQKTREIWKLDAVVDGKLWLLKHHALPSTNTIVAVQDSQVIAAICLFGESTFQLPLEEHLDLGSFRENLEGRLAELSLPGFDPKFQDNQDLFFSLYHFAICFGSSYCHYDGFVTEAPLAWTKNHAQALGFEKAFEPLKGNQVLFLNAHGNINLNQKISHHYAPQFRFPEKKFFLVAHHSMPADVLNYLFNERTNLFSTLSDFDLRVLKNIYDYGEYAKILPARTLNLPEKKVPRYPRFPMNCEGYLVSEEGDRLHIQLLDVSREGLKLRSPEGIDKCATYMLTLFVGVNRKTELIAKIVWADEAAGIAGLEIKSSDENWAQLIGYLEKDFIKIA
jgi:hypothetical protein